MNHRIPLAALLVAAGCGGQVCDFEGGSEALQAFTQKHTGDALCPDFSLVARDGEAAQPWHAAGATFRRLELEDVRLPGSTWGGARAPGARLERCDLGGADLGGAELHEARIQSCNLKGANLGGAELQGANLEQVDLREARLNGATLQGARVQATAVQGASFLAADLTEAVLDLPLEDVDLRGAILRDAEVGRCDGEARTVLAAADLRGAVLRVAGWEQVELRELDLRGARLDACESTGRPRVCQGLRVDSDTRLPTHLQPEAWCPDGIEREVDVAADDQGP